MYLPMRRALSLAKKGAWYLSHIDDAVMAEFLMAPFIMPRGRLHMWPVTNYNKYENKKCLHQIWYWINTWYQYYLVVIQGFLVHCDFMTRGRVQSYVSQERQER